MKKKGKKTSATTWRDLKTSSAKKAKKPVHWRARTRKLFSVLKILIPLLALALAGVAAWHFYSTRPEIFEISNDKIEKIEFRSDGTLTKIWLGNFLKLKSDVKLSEINIFEIKEKLERVGQIRSASVERIFPSTLRINISEYLPFARVAGLIVLPEGKSQTMSRDGKIFVCQNFEGIEKLVEISGVKVNENSLFEKIDYANADEIFSFWALAKKRFPDFAKTWQTIDVSQIESITLPGIKVKSSLGVELLFIRGDYEKQFDRLEYILAYATEKNISKMKKIDLSLKDRAIVEVPD